jgi:hypothetical protein
MPASRLIGRSTLRGAVAGIVSALAYTVLTMLALGVLQIISNNPPDRLFEASLGVLGAAICVGPFALMIGLVPGVTVGLLGGFLIGLVVAAVRPHLTQRRGAVVGLVVAAVLVILAHLLWVPAILDKDDRLAYYLFWLAGPSVMALMGLTWVGWSAAGTAVSEGT